MTSTVTLVILRDLVPREEDAPLPEKPGAPLSPPSEAMALAKRDEWTRRSKGEPRNGEAREARAPGACRAKRWRPRSE